MNLKKKLNIRFCVSRGNCRTIVFFFSTALEYIFLSKSMKRNGEKIFF